MSIAMTSLMTLMNLLNDGINSSVLREIDIDSDLNDMCSEWGIPFLRKAELKAAMRSLQTESPAVPKGKLPQVLWCTF